MTRPADDVLQEPAHAGDRAAWSTAALALLLTGAGLGQARTPPTPPGAPAVTVGRRLG